MVETYGIYNSLAAHTFPMDEPFNLNSNFQFFSTYLEFQFKFVIQLGIPILMVIN